LLPGKASAKTDRDLQEMSNVHRLFIPEGMVADILTTVKGKEGMR